MARPFFSVVIDNHNYGRFLRAAIDGILAQDFPQQDIEIVAVDDGSTVDSRDVLASYGARVRAVFQGQQGQGMAFNRGFQEARGQVVCLLDSDDYWRPTKLSAVAPLFDDASVGCVQHFLEDADAAGPLPQTFPDWPARYSLDDFLRGAARLTAASGLAFRKTKLDAALPIPNGLFFYSDDFLAVRVLFDSQIANIPRVLGTHRIHGDNWYAGCYKDARKLETDARMRKIFDAHLGGWLSERGLKLEPGFELSLKLEALRREVLYEALRARPIEAWRAWRQGWKTLRGPAAANFRLATTFLAVLSPTLYLALYSAYVESRS